MFYDTHCHPYLAKKKSSNTLLEDFFHGGGKYLNSIGVDVESSKACIELAKKYSGVYASIGIHPCDILKYKNNPIKAIHTLEKLYIDNSKCIVAIGEAGLDYHWLTSMSETSGMPESEVIALQKYFFKLQIDLAQKLKLPLIIHNRNAALDIFDILSEQDFTNFIFHCYSEDLDFAKKLIEFSPNCKLGFGGITTFKSATNIQEAAAHIPLKNIIIETDSPYLTPTPYRGKEENEPLFTKYVLSKIIDLRSEDPDFTTQQIFQNSMEMFGIHD